MFCQAGGRKRGEASDRAISGISRQFEVSRTKAGRLVMTDSAYFSSAVQKDCYKALDVERYKIVASFGPFHANGVSCFILPQKYPFGEAQR